MENGRHEQSVTAEIPSATDMKQLFSQANEHRDYTSYTWLMDAALEAKAHSIGPYLGALEENAVIVDAGSGTGKLAELFAKMFRGSKVYALDMSHELLDRATEGQSLIKPVFGNVLEQNFPDNALDVKYFSTSGHEVESFGGTGSMEKAMQVAFNELKPGGRVVVRDFAKPSLHEPVLLKILSSVGLDAVPPGTPEDAINYDLLSTRALFERFHKEFAGGNAFQYEIVHKDGEEYIKLPAEWAHEFYLRKDYTTNWRQEIKEKYTYWNEKEARKALQSAGFTNIQVVPDPNEYILKNRLLGKIALYKEDSDGSLVSLELPPTHMITIGEKPADSGIAGQNSEAIQTEVNYTELFESIVEDETNGIVRIGDKAFSVQTPPLIGTKTKIYHLKDQPNRVLKIVRSDTHNNDNVFKSLYQTINRQNILEATGTPHLKIIDHDQSGPPYRYVLQESVPEGAASAVDLIKNNQLTEEDIQQIARLVTIFEKNKEWQLDTNPFSWFRVQGEHGQTSMTYASGKVYRYDEQWEFRKIGLLQWTDPEYIKNASYFSASLPTARDYEQLKKDWLHNEGQFTTWKRYLGPDIQPEK